MQVSPTETAKKESAKLGAQIYLQQAINLLKGASLEKLLQRQDVVPLLGPSMKGAYEVKPGRYRGIFALIREEHALIFGFFKKEGMRLKRTELNRIEQRLKEIKKDL